MPRHLSIVFAATALALASTTLTARDAEAALVGGFMSAGFEAHVIEVGGFNGRGFKGHGFSGRGHFFGRKRFFGGKHFFGSRRSFRGKQFFGRKRFFGGGRPLHRGFGHGGFGLRGPAVTANAPRVVGPLVVVPPVATAPRRGTSGGETFPTKPLAAREGEGYVMQDQTDRNGAAPPASTSFPPNSPRAVGGFATGPTPVPEGCQRVSKIDRNGTGQAVRIGGTLCFEPNGQGFIVEGSRFIMNRL